MDDPELKVYRTEPYAHALSSVINQYKPEIVLVGATAIGRDLGPTVSARVATGLTADCTVLQIGDFPLNPIPGQEQKFTSYFSSAYPLPLHTPVNHVRPPGLRQGAQGRRREGGS